jgi:hypothetical protein
MWDKAGTIYVPQRLANSEILMKETHIRLDDELKIKLIQQAKLENRSLANLLVHAANVYLDGLKLRGFQSE